GGAFGFRAVRPDTAAGSGGPSLLSMDFEAARQDFQFISLCGAFNQTQNEQQNDRADERVDDRGNHTGPDHNAELRQQPTSDETADDPDDDIPNQPVAAAFNNHTGKPTGDGTDNKPNDECLYVHLFPHFAGPNRMRTMSIIADSSTDHGGGKRRAGIEAVWNVHNGVTIF